MKVYTFGYTGRTPEQLKELAEQLDAVIFDIRLAARSRDLRWRKGYLVQLLGTRYQHVKELGNVNYKTGGMENVQLFNAEAGLKRIEQSDRPVILVCMCRDPTQCHRTTVAQMLRVRGVEVEEISPPPPPGLVEQLTLWSTQ